MDALDLRRNKNVLIFFSALHGWYACLKILKTSPSPLPHFMSSSLNRQSSSSSLFSSSFIMCVWKLCALAACVLCWKLDLRYLRGYYSVANCVIIARANPISFPFSLAYIIYAQYNFIKCLIVVCDSSSSCTHTRDYNHDIFFARAPAAHTYFQFAFCCIIR